MNTIENELKQLRTWTQALAASVANLSPQVLDALATDAELPAGCPSRQSLAGMIFQDIQKKFAEVGSCMSRLERNIWHTNHEQTANPREK